MSESAKLIHNNSVRHKTSNLVDEERDDMMYSCQQAVQAIHTWKAHQLRVLQQDKCRIDVLQELNFNEVLITQDWAMKLLPQKYRETRDPNRMVWEKRHILAH